MLSPSDIIEQVRTVLESSHQGKGDTSTYLTAYQILERFPEEIKSQIMEERGDAGKGSGNYFSSASLVAEAAQAVLKEEGLVPEYLDCQGIQFMLAGTMIDSGYPICGLYRIIR